MADHPIFQMPFSKVYHLYLTKVERKGRTKEEVDQIIMWLTTYTKTDLDVLINRYVSIKHFFVGAPEINPNAHLITGKICGISVESIADPLMQRVRYLDKLIDELAKGRPLERIFRK